MAVAISTDTVFHSDDIIEGFAHIKAKKVNKAVRWELPGGATTSNRETAEAYARKLDRMIQVNMERQGLSKRDLLWS